MINNQFQQIKSLASFIDRAADRADIINKIPASSKQCFFLASLILKSGESGAEFITGQEILTKSKASHLIDIYLEAAQ